MFPRQSSRNRRLCSVTWWTITALQSIKSTYSNPFFPSDTEQLFEPGAVTHTHLCPTSNCDNTAIQYGRDAWATTLQAQDRDGMQLAILRWLNNLDALRVFVTMPRSLESSHFFQTFRLILIQTIPEINGHALRNVQR